MAISSRKGRLNHARFAGKDLNCMIDVVNATVFLSRWLAGDAAGFSG
jgi:hypothetical protein